MRTNSQEAVLSAYIVSIGKRTPREAAQDGGWLSLKTLSWFGVPIPFRPRKGRDLFLISSSLSGDSVVHHHE